MSARPIRRIADVLGLLNRGRFVEKCDEHLAKAIETLEALPDEKGTATITIEIKVAYQGGRVDIRPAVKLKLPDDKAFTETPFWTAEGGLSVQHPSQTDMFVRDAAPPRERDFETG
ncbi:hypothetical protein C3941_23640 [Kaistia algarum]|uniref:hypothetical protein n=1 Tax=Kaistia algarum TaxID=2083279 RepID=UPI000CE7A2A1|nr:hypothetical protein [Kaistia algarum]MCX5513449.1 hypothetical protein [Kaistia algarum]PPE77453.1 hypothetical protein C3941_23640 [Kaistia algarum]